MSLNSEQVRREEQARFSFERGQKCTWWLCEGARSFMTSVLTARRRFSILITIIRWFQPQVGACRTRIKFFGRRDLLDRYDAVLVGVVHCSKPDILPCAMS